MQLQLINLETLDFNHELYYFTNHKPKHQVKHLVNFKGTNLYYFITNNKLGRYTVFISQLSVYKNAQSIFREDNLIIFKDISFMSKIEARRFISAFDHQITLDFLNNNPINRKQ